MSMTGCSSRHTSLGMAALLAALCALPLQPVDAGRFYRWVDEDGNVHYTDRMPAAATDEAHTVIDGSGTVTDRRENLAAEQERQRRADAAEAERLQRTEHERKQAEDRRRDDRIIRQTFTNERDIEMTRENRVSAVQVQINIADHGIARLVEQRGDLETRLEKLSEVSPTAATIRDQIGAIDERLAQRRAEREELAAKRERIEQRFARYLQRFRELHAERD